MHYKEKIKQDIKVSECKEGEYITIRPLTLKQVGLLKIIIQAMN